MFAYTDRFPARPYILEGYLTNQTAIIGRSVNFSCPIISDIAAHIQWARYHANNDTDGLKPNITAEQVSTHTHSSLTLVMVLIDSIFLGENEVFSYLLI